MVERDDVLALNDKFGAPQTFELLDLVPPSLDLAGCVLVAEQESIVGHTGRHTENQTDIGVSEAALAHPRLGMMGEAKVMHGRPPSPCSKFAPDRKSRSHREAT